MAKRFTDSQIKGLKPKDNRYVLYDSGRKGFGIRIEPTGRKTFFLEYRFHGRSRIMTIGRYPQSSLTMARSKAALAWEKIESGADPGLEIKPAKQTDRKAITVKNLAFEYMEKHAKPKKKSWEKDQGMLDREIIPAIGSRKAKDIRKRDIITLLDRITDRGALAMANRVRSLISNMFRFAVERDILETSPCIFMGSPNKEKPRERFLTEKEIEKFWDGLNEGRMGAKLRLALQLILVTAQRPGEVVSAEWVEFDLNKKWWVIPSDKVKNKKTHRVPLSSLALELLKEIKVHSGKSDYLFPARCSTGSIKHTARASLSDAVQNHLASFGVDHFTPHDLRRSAASQMTAIGVPRLTVSKILNHAEGGTTAIYDRHSYDLEKRQALETWARKLESILYGKEAKIVNFKK